MNIALVAHDNKKELMTQFCTAYCGILAQHTLCATSSTGQQIGARIAYNEIDMVLCFDDPNTKIANEDITYIFRLCDQNNIPYASNLATAEMLVLGLARGDLDWRSIVNPKPRPFTT